MNPDLHDALFIVGVMLVAAGLYQFRPAFSLLFVGGVLMVLGVFSFVRHPPERK